MGVNGQLRDTGQVMQIKRHLGLDALLGDRRFAADSHAACEPPTQKGKPSSVRASRCSSLLDRTTRDWGFR